MSIVKTAFQSLMIADHVTESIKHDVGDMFKSVPGLPTITYVPPSRSSCVYSLTVPFCKPSHLCKCFLRDKMQYKFRMNAENNMSLGQEWTPKTTCSLLKGGSRGGRSPPPKPTKVKLYSPWFCTIQKTVFATEGHFVVHCFVTGVLWSIFHLSYSSEVIIMGVGRIFSRGEQ